MADRMKEEKILHGLPLAYPSQSGFFSFNIAEKIVDNNELSTIC